MEGRHIFGALENFYEVGGILEAAVLGNGVNGFVAEPEHGLGMGNAQGSQGIPQGYAVNFLIFPGKMVFADKKAAG